ncbi:hypothetical protein Val02_05400 [Virgisporangium aliadipatigenens]|uniref:Uncharacterized protein n=1 Tax=Virgisporangium aliadipatigenens TaxID=741659 RepID=A0A8J3YEI1_9ACTN|nr:hypothetical protein [Virgisporangium aliadipatigenens]GIJ43654.1 hypothetical protein Val02_05400 [Virgisporangium aliadipatigenens]
MDERADPVEILARVGRFDSRERAFDVWVHKARKAGWSVEVRATTFDVPGTGCGVVDIEGLPYRVHHGPRVRHLVGIVEPGKHLIASAVDATLGRADGTVFRWEFGYAAWAEPVIG